jgi:hypothetical protein
MKTYQLPLLILFLGVLFFGVATSESMEAIAPKDTVQIVQNQPVKSSSLVIEAQQKNYNVVPLHTLINVISVAEALQVYDGKTKVHLDAQNLTYFASKTALSVVINYTQIYTEESNFFVVSLLS